MVDCIFISYRRQDSDAYAGRIYDKLSNYYFSKQLFMDVDAIHGGENFKEKISSAITSSKVFLAIIGDQWLTVTDNHGNTRINNNNDPVKYEIQNALKKGMVVIPVLVSSATFPSIDFLPSEIKKITSLNAIEIRHNHFDSDMSVLLCTVQKHVFPIKKYIKISSYIILPLLVAFGAYSSILKSKTENDLNQAHERLNMSKSYSREEYDDAYEILNECIFVNGKYDNNNWFEIIKNTKDIEDETKEFLKRKFGDSVKSYLRLSFDDVNLIKLAKAARLVCKNNGDVK